MLSERSVRKPSGSEFGHHGLSNGAVNGKTLQLLLKKMILLVVYNYIKIMARDFCLLQKGTAPTCELYDLHLPLPFSENALTFSKAAHGFTRDFNTMHV